MRIAPTTHHLTTHHPYKDLRSTTGLLSHARTHAPHMCHKYPLAPGLYKQIQAGSAGWVGESATTQYVLSNNGSHCMGTRWPQTMGLTLAVWSEYGVALCRYVHNRK